MTTNQEGLHATVRALTSTTRSYNEDWHALFDADGIAAGTFNERMLAWINATLGTSYTNLNGAMQAFAVEQGFANWASMNTFVTSLASFLLSRYGPYGMVMDFTDASISINDETDVLDYSSQGTVSATTGALLGPGSKLVYSAPSAKLTEQADGYLGFQAHNLYLNSAAPANQSITVISGATYAITLTGSVSVTASGAATGTWTAGTNTFTAATTTLTLGSTSGSGTVHVRRTPSVSTYVATAGAIVYDLPYVYSGGVKTGILVELAATNLALRSNDFTNASWTKSNLTAALTATGPDGVANSASTLTATAGNATALQAITSASSSRVTSVYIKRRTGSGNIDLTQDNGSTWTTQTVTSSWTRVSLAAVTSTNPTVGIRIVTSGDEVDVWCLQHETGTVVTSPIITYGSSVVRAADSLKVAVANFPAGTAHTLYMELQRPEKDVTATFMTLQGTGTDFIQLIDDSANLRGVVRTVADGVTATLAIATENALNTPFKIAISADTTADGVHNGGAVVSDPSCICATSFATLDIGHVSLTRPMLVKTAAYFPARKSGADLQEVTA